MAFEICWGFVVLCLCRRAYPTTTHLHNIHLGFAQECLWRHTWRATNASVAFPHCCSAIPLTRHRWRNMVAYGTVATSVLLASDALRFVAPQLQRYKRSRSLVLATWAPYFNAPQIVKLGRLRHRFHKRVVSFTRGTICGATNTLVERGPKRRRV